MSEGNGDCMPNNTYGGENKRSADSRELPGGVGKRSTLQNEHYRNQGLAQGAGGERRKSLAKRENHNKKDPKKKDTEDGKFCCT